MKVENMTSAQGNKIANQFIVSGYNVRIDGHNYYKVIAFQSYDSTIVVRGNHETTGERITILDKDTWDYSTTTSKYRNQFLGETKKETQKKIDSGEYKLANLN